MNREQLRWFFHGWFAKLERPYLEKQLFESFDDFMEGQTVSLKDGEAIYEWHDVLRFLRGLPPH